MKYILRQFLIFAEDQRTRDMLELYRAASSPTIRALETTLFALAATNFCISVHLANA
jgi:hypothetical protein